MSVARAKIVEIEVGQRLRSYDGDKVLALMESIQELGLRTPISVAREGEARYRLVAGLHRLEACRRLGWENIDVVQVDGLDEIDQQMWEIDENLVRAELSEGERSEHLLRRKRLFDLKREQKRLSGEAASVRPQHEIGFATDTAERTGLTKRHINRSIRRAERIADDVREAIRLSPSFRKAVELDALADLTHADQRRAVQMVAQDEVRSFREARDRLISGRKPTDRDRQLRALVAAWKAASTEARAAFLQDVGSELSSSNQAGLTGEQDSSVAGVRHLVQEDETPAAG